MRRFFSGIKCSTLTPEAHAFVGTLTNSAADNQAAAYLLRSGLHSGLLILVDHGDRNPALISLEEGSLPDKTVWQAVAPTGLTPHQIERDDQNRLQLPVSNGASIYLVTWPETGPEATDQP